jgi:hypothetical protein
MKKSEQSLELHLYSKETSSCLTISPINGEATVRYAELISIFGQYKDGAVAVEPEHVMNAELRQKICTFCDRYKKHYPILNRFQKAFSKIPEGNHFFILPKEIVDNAEVICLYNYIDARNMKLSEEDTVSMCNESNAGHLSIFTPLLDHYHISVASSGTRTHIGESDNRQCPQASHGQA